MDVSLTARVERACHDAWPAREATIVGDWIAYRSGGPTKRINSASPVPGRTGECLPDPGAVAALYASWGQPAIFRVPSFAVGVDAQLTSAGFAPLMGHAITLYAEFTDRHVADPKVSLTPNPDAEWLAARLRFAHQARPGPAYFADMTARIGHPAAFASLVADGRVVAIAYAVAAHGLAVVEAVATDLAMRRRGFAHRCVSTLLAWAQRRRCEEACLQILNDNIHAMTLYSRLGFTTRLYDYHYRRNGEAEERA